MLTVCTWLWGDKFGADDVNKLAASVRRHLKQEHRFICITDNDALEPSQAVADIRLIEEEDEHLLTQRGCFCRLRMFDPKWQARNGVDDRFVCIDLDTVITGSLDPLFDRPEPFVIMQGGNASNPCPYNGALMMLRAGAHPDVWEDFSLEAASKVPFYEFPDDQGWLWHKIPNAAGWKCGRESGVFVFHKPGWPGWRHKDSTCGDPLPEGARLVTFSGWRNPKRFAHLDWVKKHWTA